MDKENRQTLSWLSLEEQVESRGYTWLDAAGTGERSGDFGEAVRRRQVYRRQAGLLGRDETVLVPAQVDALKSASLARAEARIAAAPDRVRAGNAEAFAGVYERPVDLPHGRFAVMASAKEFKLVPWRPELERHRGKTLSVTARANGVSFRPVRSRGIGQ